MLMSVTFCTHWKNISKGYFCHRISLLQRFRGTSVSLLHSVGYWIGWRHAAVLADSCCPQQYGHTGKAWVTLVLVAQTSFLQLQVGSLSTVLSNCDCIRTVFPFGRGCKLAEVFQTFHAVSVHPDKQRQKLLFISIYERLVKSDVCYRHSENTAHPVPVSFFTDSFFSLCDVGACQRKCSRTDSK